MRLKGKVALLCGVGSGMGRATALLFAQEGALVAINARNGKTLQETVHRITSQKGEATVITGDVSRRSEADRVVNETVRQYGRLDVLYCGVGGSFEPDRGLSELDESYWQQALANTTNSLYNLAQAVRPPMKEQGGGRVVAVSASFSVRQEGNPAYGAAKGAVNGLSQNLARELYPDNIRVNVIAPGLFRGELGEGKIGPPPPTLARTGHREDIAYAALYLASDESSWVTGQVLSVDGGVDVGTRPLWQFERDS